MQPLRSVLLAFAERPEVAGAVVVSDDGLVVEASLDQGLDRDALAALAMSAIRSADALTHAAQRGELGQLVLDGDNGLLILQRLPNRAVLLVLTREDCDPGDLLYQIRRHAPALTSLL